MNEFTRSDKPGVRKARLTSSKANPVSHFAPKRDLRVPRKNAVPSKYAKRKSVHGNWLVNDASSWAEMDLALALYQTNGPELVKIIKDGVPSHFVEVLTERMAMPKEKFYKTIGLIRATVDRKVRAEKILDQDESERMIGMARLVGQAQSIVENAGASENFDAAQWVSGWLDRPLPALGGKRPGEFMDTGIGRSLVADLLAQQQSSAYG
jgi:putative toxin-antitoxin system antitoxin component (TIGR02293 family)